jgi:iron complex outermembrane receptor protein
VADQPTQPLFSLRGIGSGDFGIGTDAPVGVYVDGVYTGKTAGALLNFNDVKRVEVLKGPQGTLFGRNSAGGAISVVTNDPSAGSRPTACCGWEAGTTRHVEAMVNQPLGADWALRVSMTGQFSHGWQHDARRAAKNVANTRWGTTLRSHGRRRTAARLVLAWEHEELNQRAAAVDRPCWRRRASAPTRDLPRPAHRAAEERCRRQPRMAAFRRPDLRAEHALGWADFTSTTAYRHFNSINRTDNDGTNQIATYLQTGKRRGQLDLAAGLQARRAQCACRLAGGCEPVLRTRAADERGHDLHRRARHHLRQPGRHRALTATINGLAQAVGVPASTCSARAGRRRWTTAAATRRWRSTAMPSGTWGPART